MGPLFITMRAAVGIWLGTSIEDLVLLTTLFLTFRATGRPRPWQIVAGWYMGIGFLAAISGAAAVGLILVPENWVGVLGCVPLTIGIYELIRTIRARGGNSSGKRVMPWRALSIAALAISNGGDNVSVYVPVFRAVGLSKSLEMVAVFAVCIAVWCAAASLLGSHKKLVGLIELYGHWVVPLVLIGIGLLIITDTGFFTHLA